MHSHRLIIVPWRVKSVDVVIRNFTLGQVVFIFFQKNLMWLKLRMFIRQTEPKFGLKKDMKVKTFKHILHYWLIPVGTWCRSWWFFYKKFRLLKIRNLKWFWMFLKIGSWWKFAKKERNTLHLGRLSRRKFFGTVALILNTDPNVQL
jgi:hypothetical protein